MTAPEIIALPFISTDKRGAAAASLSMSSAGLSLVCGPRLA